MSADELLYFAYGSNLYLPRMVDRVPSARVLGQARLHGHKVRFHKVGIDGSGKCNLVTTGGEQDLVWGVLYRMHGAERQALDAVEVPDYKMRFVEVQLADALLSAFTYQAPLATTDDRLLPFTWYRDLVLAGAAEQGLPADYIAELAGVGAVVDPDPERERRNRYDGRLGCTG